MKSGLTLGHQETLVITVTKEMAASFGGEMVHATLSTVSMVYYMEWVGRKVILPFLEEDEEGIGGAISVKHCAPAPIGKQITFVATVIDITDRKVVCSVIAKHNRAIVGEAEFTQMILPKAQIIEKIERMK
jgi:predicted thioesterase